MSSSYVLPSSALPHARDGRLIPLGVTSARRLLSLPAIPAVAETVPGFEMGVWTALFVPARTPRSIIERLDTATREALPHLGARFAELGLGPFVASPEDVAASLRDEIAKWTGVIRTARITAD